MSMTGLAGRPAIVGVGTTSYGLLPEYDQYDLGAWALKEALADSGLSLGDLDGLIVSRIGDYQRFGEMLGINPRFTAQLPGQGRMAGIAVQQAAMAIATGMASVVAIVYGNNGRSSHDRYGGEGDQYGSGGAGQWFPYGMTSPGALHAMLFERHSALYGTTSAQLAEIAVTFRQHATLNPQAVLRDPISIDTHQNSRFICEPLHLFDYCLINDGGVALIMTGQDRAKDCRKKPVYIRGVEQATALSDSSMPPDDFWRKPMQSISKRIYKQADCSRDELDALMIYDNFTPTVLFSLEGYGFCPIGESGPWVSEGHLRLGGRFPSNTSGGHLSESYMQGWALNVEAVRQIRGECGDRQVVNAELIQYMAAAPICTSIIYGASPR